MFPKAQLLVFCLLAKTYALHHHQAQPGYVGPGYSGYVAPAAGTPYRGYDDYASPPQPYSFGYDTVDEYGNRQFRSEQGDSGNVKTGSYGYQDVYGLYRRVNYVADANGFRATIDTNEPGTAPGASADAVFNAAPVVPPIPAGAVAPAARGAPATYGATRAAPYYNNGYKGYGRYGYNPYGRGAGTNTPYGRYGYAPNGAALGGYAYGGYSPNGYGRTGYAAGAYAPGRYSAPNGYSSWSPGAYGYRRR